MSNINDADHPEWRQLCEAAFLETDPVKLLVRIADARVAILERIEGCSKSNDERAKLWDALATLDGLRRIAERHNGYQTKAS